jgi:two-component system sensor histidine kinase KdpD
MEDASRPNPDELLAHIKTTEQKEKKGKLKIYLGMSAGVGKTFAMLQDASMAYGRKVDVLIGYVETHKRSDTEFLLFHLPQLDRKKIQYKGFELEEMDIDEILIRKPKLVVVDELAHTNAPGSRHKKRYLDVLELLDNGIDVFTALNVQHLESLADTVSQITGIIIKEKVPDSILEAADEIELVDISPDELLQRLADGKVYTADKTADAVNNFFRKGNLSALRELALRLTADRVDKQVRHYMKENKIAGPWKSTQRILIGISASPNSIDLVRWARRIAYTMEASWIAVNVETPKILTEEEKKSLNKNIELAKELGAEVISTVDVDVVNGLLRIAKRENVSHVVIGKSHHENFFYRLFGKDIVSRLISESGKIDVYIASGESVIQEKKKIFRVPDAQSGFSKYFLSASIVFAVAAVCFIFSSFLGYQTIALIFLFVVCLMPLILGPGPVLLAAVMSPLIWNFFFVPPHFTLIISRTEDILTFIMFFIVAYVTGVLTTRIRQRERSVRQREERAIALYNLANDLSQANNMEEVITNSIKNLKKVFESDAVIFVSDENSKSVKQFIGNGSGKVSEKELSVAQWIYSNEKRAGRFTDSLTSAEYVYYPLKNQRGTYGVAGLKIQNENFYHEHETLIDNFMNQISGAVEREFLNQKANKTLVLEESEKLYKTLFDSLSHELKTPIAAIMGSSNLLLNIKTENNAGTREQLYNEIHTASIRLNRLVENLLDMARLESGKLIPNFQLHDVQDLINSAIEQFKTELNKHEITVTISDKMPLLKIDFGLMEQVIKNLLQNALIYTQEDSKIEVQASYDDKSGYIMISDNGKGIPDKDVQNIFDKFYRVNNKIAGGTGLGLSISKGIVEAMKGTISVENKNTGGLKFTIKLPLN